MNYESTQNGMKRITSKHIMNHGSALNLAGEVHSTERHVYMWSQNCLMKVTDAESVDLEYAKKIIIEEIERRNK